MNFEWKLILPFSVCPDVKQCSMPNNIEDDKLVQLEMIPSEKGLSTDPSNNKESKSVDAELDIKSEIDPPRLEKLSGLVQEASSAMAEKESNICLKTVEVDGVSTGGKEGMSFQPLYSRIEYVLYAFSKTEQAVF